MNNNNDDRNLSSEEKFIVYWKERRNSKLRFVLIQGILYWAYPVLLIVMIIGLVSGAQDIDSILLTLPTRIVIWTLVGILFGSFMWFLNERKYKKLTNKEE